MLASKPKIAFFDFAGCEGCQLTVVDSLQDHLDLLEAVEIVQFREAMSEREDTYQIAFVEGACTRASDEVRLQAIRAQATLVIALGACAHLGGVNTLRNRYPLSEAQRIVYGRVNQASDGYGARPIGAVIQVDGFVPGCPIDRDEFTAVVKALLQGRQPRLPAYPVCVECKLRENACVFERGEACVGPLTRAGCKAICPTYGTGCLGCRGFIAEPNINWLEIAAAEHGVAVDLIRAKTQLFLSYQLKELEEAHDGRR